MTEKETTAERTKREIQELYAIVEKIAGRKLTPIDQMELLEWNHTIYESILAQAGINI